MLFVWYKVSFDEKWSHGSAVCETVYFFVEFVCVFPWKCVSLNNQNRGKIMDGILRKLPIGIQTFEKLREGDYLMWIRLLLYGELLQRRLLIF